MESSAFNRQGEKSPPHQGAKSMAWRPVPLGFQHSSGYAAGSFSSYSCWALLSLHELAWFVFDWNSFQHLLLRERTITLNIYTR